MANGSCEESCSVSLLKKSHFATNVIDFRTTVDDIRKFSSCQIIPILQKTMSSPVQTLTV